MFALMKKRSVCAVLVGVVGGSLAGCVELAPPSADDLGGVGPAGGKRVCDSDTACVFDDIPNRSLGDARLRLNDKNNLMVENIGTSGRDGVRQFGVPHDTVWMAMGLACPNFVESIEGSKAEIIMYGDGAVANEVISTLTIENIGNDTIVAEADLSPVGVTTYQVTVLDGDAIVWQGEGLDTSQVLLNPTQDFVAVACTLHEDGTVWIDYQITFKMELVVPDGSTVVGDTVRIRGENQTSFPRVQRAFDNFFTKMPAVEMTYQAVGSVPTMEME